MYVCVYMQLKGFGANSSFEMMNDVVRVAPVTIRSTLSLSLHSHEHLYASMTRMYGSMLVCVRVYATQGLRCKYVI